MNFHRIELGFVKVVLAGVKWRIELGSNKGVGFILKIYIPFVSYEFLVRRI